MAENPNVDKNKVGKYTIYFKHYSVSIFQVSDQTHWFFPFCISSNICITCWAQNSIFPSVQTIGQQENENRMTVDISLKYATFIDMVWIILALIKDYIFTSRKQTVIHVPPEHRALGTRELVTSIVQ